MNVVKSKPGFNKVGSEHQGLSRLVIEMMAIIFSVLLALMLNEWREDVKNKKLARNIEETIFQEINNNNQEIQRAFTYHQTLLKQIRTGEGTELSGTVDLKEQHVDWTNTKELKEFMLQEMKEDGYTPTEFVLAQESDNRFLIILDDNRGYAIVDKNQLKIYLTRRILLKPAEINNTAWETAQAMQAVLHLDYQLVDLMSRVYRLQQFHETQVRTILSMLYSGNFEIPALEDLVNTEKNLITLYQQIVEKLDFKHHK